MMTKPLTSHRYPKLRLILTAATTEALESFLPSPQAVCERSFPESRNPHRETPCPPCDSDSS